MLRLGFIGCGGISTAHLNGLVELQQAGLQRFVLTAACDVDTVRAEALADTAARELGERPAVFTDYRALLDSGKVDAVSVMVQHHLHHTIARDAFSAGIHVQMQKPIAISPRFAGQMIADARSHARVLTVAEPWILGAGNRALARAVRDGLIGRLYLVLDYATMVTRGGFFANTPWRHMKAYAGAGLINDHGVHRTHQFIDVGGPIDEVFAYVELFEPVLSSAGMELKADGEDTAVTVCHFASGALAHFMCSSAGHGERANGIWWYGSKGVIRPNQYVKFDDDTTIAWDELIDRYAPDVVRGDFAHSYIDLAGAIEHGTPAVSNAEEAASALAVVFAALESATVGQPVRVTTILDGEAHTYEDTVVQAMQSI